MMMTMLKKRQRKKIMKGRTYSKLNNNNNESYETSTYQEEDYGRWEVLIETLREGSTVEYCKDGGISGTGDYVELILPAETRQPVSPPSSGKRCFLIALNATFSSCFRLSKSKKSNDHTNRPRFETKQYPPDKCDQSPADVAVHRHQY